MKTLLFSHPQFCPRVAGRRLAEELLDALVDLSAALATRGRLLILGGGQPTDTAYRMARHRLARAGLLVVGRSGGRTPLLQLTAAGRQAGEAALRPASFWKARWDGYWYLLTYDVPEVDRRYRRDLRLFLRRLRMGGLQGSVWITPRDIRPDFDDLCRAAAVGPYAHLFRAQHVPGWMGRDMVTAAWPFERLRRAQQWYLDMSERALGRLRHPLPAGDILQLAAGAATAYRAVMADDPLLPRALWPAGYLGETVWKRHLDLQARLADRLG